MPVKEPPRSLKTPAGPAYPTAWDLPRSRLADEPHPDDSFLKTGRVDGFLSGPRRARKCLKTKQNKTKKLLHVIILRFVLSGQLQIDNETSFTSKVAQVVSKLLDTVCYFHCAWRHQFSGKIERNNMVWHGFY